MYVKKKKILFGSHLLYLRVNVAAQDLDSTKTVNEYPFHSKVIAITSPTAGDPATCLLAERD